MATRAPSGSTRTLTKKPRTKRKRQCELGTTCPYQDEYQHNLEFAHDGDSGGSSNSSGNRNKTHSSAGLTGVQKKNTGLNGTGLLKGTGSRGRKLAVAADMKRAERTLRNDGEHSLGGNAGDVRDAQRARRAMQMQKQIQEGAQQQRSASMTGPGGGGGGRDGGGGCGAAAAGVRSTSTAPKRAAADTWQEENRRKARKQKATSRDGARQDQEREIVEVDLDTDDDDEDATITSATSTKPIRSPATAAANRSSVNESPPTTTSTLARVGAVESWEDGAQRQDERTLDGWDCNVCTFRNSKMLGLKVDLACAVCGCKNYP